MFEIRTTVLVTVAKINEGNKVSITFASFFVGKLRFRVRQETSAANPMNQFVRFVGKLFLAFARQFRLRSG